MDAAGVPTMVPSNITVASEISAARKFGTTPRIQTPSISGAQISATIFNRSIGERSGLSNSLRNNVDRASELDTAAATPNWTNNEIRTSLGSIGFTVLLYVDRSPPRRPVAPRRCVCIRPVRPASIE